jgi:hypothetical protein
VSRFNREHLAFLRNQSFYEIKTYLATLKNYSQLIKNAFIASSSEKINNQTEKINKFQNAMIAIESTDLNHPHPLPSP